MEKISVLIPTRKRLSLLNNTLYTLQGSFKQDYFDTLYILNTSRNILSKKDLKIFPKRTLIFNSYPKNLLEGKNEVISKIKSKWVLILDDDLEFNTTLLEDFYNKLNKYSFDLASGILKNRRFYKKPDFIYLVPYGKISFYGVPSLNYKKLGDTNPFIADFLPGGFLLAKTEVLKKLKYDESFLLPFYGEDTDITFRAKKQKKKLYVFKDIQALHLQHPTGGVRKKISKNTFFYNFGFNNAYFIFKHFSVYTYLFYTFFRFRDFVYVLKQFKLDIYKSFIKGVCNGYKKARN